MSLIYLGWEFICVVCITLLCVQTIPILSAFFLCHPYIPLSNLKNFSFTCRYIGRQWSCIHFTHCCRYWLSTHPATVPVSPGIRPTDCVSKHPAGHRAKLPVHVPRQSLSVGRLLPPSSRQRHVLHHLPSVEGELSWMFPFHRVQLSHQPLDPG